MNNSIINPSLVIYEQLTNGIVTIIFTCLLMYYTLLDSKTPHIDAEFEIVEKVNPRYPHYLTMVIELVYLPYCLHRYVTSYYAAAYMETELNSYRLIGMLLFLLGVCVRNTAKRQLGEYFTYNITIKPNHTLIETGLYRYIMHPSYTGLICMCIGKAVFFLLSVELALSNALIVFAVPIRIMYEERALKIKFGTQFEDYKKGRWRLIPFIF